MLVAIKLLHTLIWAFMAGIIVALPFLAILRRFRLAAIVSGIIFLEGILLAVNHYRCPLSDLAARFTTSRAHNFDIYLPGWLAQHNKLIFGLLFMVGEFVLLASWLKYRHTASTR